MNYIIGEYLVKVRFVGNVLIPVYRFRVYRKGWFNFWFRVWEEHILRNDINHVLTSCEWVIANYHRNVRRWEV